MFILFLVWDLIVATSLAFSKENDALWRKVFSIETDEGLRDMIFYISVGLLVCLFGASFYFFTLGNNLILFSVTLLWYLFLKVIVSVVIKSQ